MAVPRDTVEPALPRRRRFNRPADNPLVGAVGRVRLPLGAKLVAGFAVVAALLALVIALGVVALRQANARGTKLLALQKQTAYEQLLVSDGRQLASLLDQRGSGLAEGGLYRLSQSVRLQLDYSIDNTLRQLLSDFGVAGYGIASKPQMLRWDPVLARKLQRELTTAQSSFTRIEALDTQGSQPKRAALVRVTSINSAAQSQLTQLASSTSMRAQALVVQNRNAYGNSRNLLVGIGAGSFALALALGLLLSWSLVVPVRRTQARLAQIAGGDFSGHVEVPNRDEIGALAADVNQMNDELQRLYAELETASRHKSEFLATMSHELRTPLNAIIGFSEVLHEQMFGELNERQLAYVNDVLEAGKHLLSLINDVLDLAKIEAGRMELELSQVAIPDVLKSAVSIHAERANRGGIELELSTRPEEIVVAADERRLRQVVFNLVSNAVKFTPSGGRVEISALAENGQVEVAVADTGPGIAPADLKTIFEEFEQTTGGKKAEGTGLGLPLSRKLVQLHGGRLWAESEPGQGSTFRFTLPVRQEVP